MALAVEADVRGVLSEEREKKMVRAVNLAWQGWWDCNIRSQCPHARTRANIYFDLLMKRLQEEFASDPKAKFIYKNESFKIVFDDLVVVRFKKADDKGFGSNVPTEESLSFCEQEACIPGLLPDLQKVEIVYHLNVTQTAISAVVVQARDGEMRLWSYKLDMAANMGAAATVILLPQQPTPTTSSPTGDMVKPKESRQDKKLQDN